MPKSRFVRVIGTAIVLGGYGRSGTTLLRTMLDSHVRICCGPESNVFRRRALDAEALAAVSTAFSSPWKRDLDARDRRIFKRVAGDLLIELGYARGHDW